MKPGEKDDDQDFDIGAHNYEYVPRPKPDAIWWWYDQQIERLREMLHTPQVYIYDVSAKSILDLINRIEASPDYMNEEQRRAFDVLKKEVTG